VLVSSRSYDEYVAMFALSPEDLSGSVLDCSAGAASFVTLATRRGARAVALDPVYALAREQLADAVRADLERGGAIAHQHPDRFGWDWFGSPEARDRLRKAAAAQFLASLATPGSRYVAAELPRLPFRDASFDLALCSHLLFCWADVLGLGWHLAAVSELTRVAREVRIFPTVVQGAGDPVPFWDELMTSLAKRGLRAEERRVDYRFQLAADRMLVVTQQ
jgi:SAM-dependent methyltransferase